MDLVTRRLWSRQAGARQVAQSARAEHIPEHRIVVAGLWGQAHGHLAKC